MKNFEDVIAREKKRQYEMPEKDQFVFSTLTQIQYDKSRSLHRLLIAATVGFSALALMVQILFIQSASFTEIAMQTKIILSQKPYYLAIFNLGLVGLIVALRRFRYF